MQTNFLRQTKHKKRREKTVKLKLREIQTQYKWKKKKEPDKSKQTKLKSARLQQAFHIHYVRENQTKLHRGRDIIQVYLVFHPIGLLGNNCGKNGE